MRYHYLRDPVFLFCLALYLLNRWLLKPLFPSVFLHSYLNDLICIPFWVPLMVFAMRSLRLRADGPPTAAEILIPLVVWCVLFELLLPAVPWFQGLAVRDCNDILFYILGATAAAILWRTLYGRRVTPQGTVCN